MGHHPLPWRLSVALDLWCLAKVDDWCINCILNLAAQFPVWLFRWPFFVDPQILTSDCHLPEIVVKLSTQWCILATELAAVFQVEWVLSPLPFSVPVWGWYMVCKMTVARPSVIRFFCFCRLYSLHIGLPDRTDNPEIVLLGKQQLPLLQSLKISSEHTCYPTISGIGETFKRLHVLHNTSWHCLWPYLLFFMWMWANMSALC